MKKQYNIEKAKIEDAEKILEYYKIVCIETDNLSYGEGGLPFSIEEKEKAINYFDDHNKGIYLLAKDGGNIIGLCKTQLYSEAERFCHIYSLTISVKKVYWGNGIAKDLLTRSINHVKEIGARKLILYVKEDNFTAIQLYRKLGFEVEAVLRDHMNIDGIYYDNYIMGLVFR